MTPPTRRCLSPRFFFSSAFFALSLASLPAPAAAMVMRDAMASLKGLSPIGLPTVPTLRDRVVEAGLDAVGTPYSWGGEDPDEGFDCSGLVSFVFRQVAGVDLPRRARDQRGKGRAVRRGQLQPGDLVFFGTRRRGQTSHVGIYIGNNEFVHAPSRGETVRVDRLDNVYWSRHFNGARRYFAPTGDTAVAVANRAR